MLHHGQTDQRSSGRIHEVAEILGREITMKKILKKRTKSRGARRKATAPTTVQALMKDFSVLTYEGFAAASRIERAARTKARTSIKALGPAPGIEALQQVAASGDQPMQIEVIPLLLKRNSKQADQILIQMAAPGQASAVRAAAISGMGESKRKRYFDVILDASENPDSEVRTSALRALPGMRTERAVSRLRAAVKDMRLSVFERRDVLFGLGYSRDADFLSLCEWALREDKELGGWAAYDLIPRNGRRVPGAHDLALKLLLERNPRLRREGVTLLAMHDDLRAMPYLLKMARSANAKIRKEGLSGIKHLAERIAKRDRQTLRHVQAVVLAALHDNDEEVRADAVDLIALVQLPDPTKLLLAALRDSSARVQHYAAGNFRQNCDPEGVAAMVGLLRKSKDSDLVNAAIDCVVNARHPNARELLFPLLTKGARETRIEAAIKLLGLGDKRGWSVLAAGVQDRTWDWTAYGRGEILGAVAASKDPRATGILLSALRNYDPDHVSDMNMIGTCIRGLRKLGDRRAIEPLRKFLRQPEHANLWRGGRCCLLMTGVPRFYPRVS